MGRGRTLLLGNVGQQLDIREAEEVLASLCIEVESATQADAPIRQGMRVTRSREGSEVDPMNLVPGFPLRSLRGFA